VVGQVADADVVAGVEVVGHEVLERRGQPEAERVRRQFAQIDAVPQDAAAFRVVEAAQQLHHGALAGPVDADDRE
jgi:hypothetical protein